MTTLDAGAVFADLLRAALDDTGTKLPALVERRVVARMVELAALAGLEVHRGDE